MLPGVTLGDFYLVTFIIGLNVVVLQYIYTKMFLFCEAKEYANNIVNVERYERSMKLTGFFGILALQGSCFGKEWEGGLC